MKRGISIFNLLGGTILLACITLSAGLLLVHYQYAKEQAARERDNTFAAKHALLQSVFDARLEQLGLQLRHLVQQEELRFDGLKDATVEELHQNLHELGTQGHLEVFDRLIIAPADGSYCHSHGDPFFGDNCQELIRQFDSALYRQHLYNTGDQTGILLREPLTDPSAGRVIGHLYAALVLTDNFALMNRTSLGTRTRTEPTAITLAVDGQVQAANLRLNSAQQAAATAALAAPGQVVRSGEIYARSDNLHLDHESHHLQSVVLVNAQRYDRLIERMVEQALSVASLGTLVAILVSMLAVKLTLQPLVTLLHYTRDPNAKPEQPPTGAVREINQISRCIANHLGELSHSQRTLRRYSQELEATHDEVQRTNHSLHQRTRDLEAANQRLENLNSTNKALLHQLFHLQEEERKHLAKELHDELGQTLAAVSTEAHLLQQSLPPDSADQHTARAIYQRAREMYDVVYHRITSLRPLPLNDLGLADAVRHMPVIDQLRQQGCEVEFDLPPLPRLQGNIEINLFRVAQEALTNIHRHADATQAAVSLQFNDGCLQLLIRDNGHGFAPNAIASHAGFGIGGMRERCQAVSGALYLESGGNGTSVLAEIPVSAELVGA